MEDNTARFGAAFAALIAIGAAFASFAYNPQPDTSDFITEDDADDKFAAKAPEGESYVTDRYLDLRLQTERLLAEKNWTTAINAATSDEKVRTIVNSVINDPNLDIQNAAEVGSAINTALAPYLKTLDADTRYATQAALDAATAGISASSRSAGIPATGCLAGAGFGNLKGAWFADWPAYQGWLNDTMFAHNGTVVYHQLGELGTEGCEVSANFKVVSSNVAFEDMPDWTYAPDTCVAQLWPGQSSYLGKPLLAKVSRYMAEKNNTAVKEGGSIEFRVSGTLGTNGCKLYQQVRQGTGVPIKDLPATQGSGTLAQCTSNPSTATNGKVSTVTLKTTDSWVQIDDPPQGNVNYTWNFPDGVQAVWGPNWGSMTSSPMMLNGTNQNFGTITLPIRIGYSGGIGTCLQGTLTAP